MSKTPTFGFVPTNPTSKSFAHEISTFGFVPVNPTSRSFELDGPDMPDLAWLYADERIERILSPSDKAKVTV